MNYLKSIVAVVSAALITFQTLATDGVSVQDWCTIGVAVLTAFGVYLVPEVEARLPWVKATLAVLLGGAQAAVQVAANGAITGQGWLTIVIATLGAIMVLGVQNRTAAAPPTIPPAAV